MSISRRWLASQSFFQRCVFYWWDLIKVLPEKHLCLLRSLLISLVYSCPPNSNLRWHFFSCLMFKDCEISSDKQDFVCQRPNSILQLSIPLSFYLKHSRVSTTSFSSVPFSQIPLLPLTYVSSFILFHPLFKIRSCTWSNIFTIWLDIWCKNVIIW